MAGNETQVRARHIISRWCCMLQLHCMLHDGLRIGTRLKPSLHVGWTKPGQAESADASLFDRISSKLSQDLETWGRRDACTKYTATIGCHGLCTGGTRSKESQCRQKIMPLTLNRAARGLGASPQPTNISRSLFSLVSSFLVWCVSRVVPHFWSRTAPLFTACRPCFRGWPVWAMAVPGDKKMPRLDMDPLQWISMVSLPQ